jgi:hypothetical protein
MLQRLARRGGSVPPGIGPGPDNKLPAPKFMAPNTNVRTIIRIAIFMINFLQYFPSSEFLPRKLRIDYMKTRSALQKLILHAVFMNSPMLHIGQGNEFHIRGLIFVKRHRANILNSLTYIKSRQMWFCDFRQCFRVKIGKATIVPFGTLIKKITSLNITKAFRPTFLARFSDTIHLNATGHFTAIS